MITNSAANHSSPGAVSCKETIPVAGIEVPPVKRSRQVQKPVSGKDKERIPP